MLVIETVILCSAFFALCFLGTGTDEKNLRNYMSYPDEVQKQIKEIEEYQGKYKETGRFVAWIANFLLFTVLFLFFGIAIRQTSFMHNFICLLILGETLNAFDLIVIDLLWWRNTKRIRLLKIPQKELYQNPKKHIEAFLRALVLYFFVAVLDGYLLTLFWPTTIVRVIYGYHTSRSGQNDNSCNLWYLTCTIIRHSRCPLPSCNES